LRLPELERALNLLLGAAFVLVDFVDFRVVGIARWGRRFVWNYQAGTVRERIVQDMRVFDSDILQKAVGLIYKCLADSHDNVESLDNFAKDGVFFVQVVQIGPDSDEERRRVRI